MGNGLKIVSSFWFVSCRKIIMKRRQFLKSAAVVGASGLILPRVKLFGAEAPSNKLNIDRKSVV